MAAQFERLKRRRLSFEPLEHRRVLAALPFGAAAQDTGEFLLGKVIVTPVLLESNGQIDTSSEDWSQAHIDEVLENIQQGTDWWVQTLANQTPIDGLLSFTIDTTYATTPVETKYEPISRRSNDYFLYATEFLAGLGYNSGSLETNMRDFNHAQRTNTPGGADWAFTIFVVPSVNDGDGQFAPGGSFNRAFAFAGGLFMIVPSTRPASTYAHELGHMFWARDEYAGGGSFYDQRGYYNTQNTNAANNPEPGFVQQPSIMASGDGPGGLLGIAYANYISPPSTLAQVGWQDSDSDGIFDVIDVPHLLSGQGYFDSAAGKYRFNGSATVQTLPNRNSSGRQNDITINRISQIQYRFDGGPWQVASEPDSYTVDLALELNVPANAMQIEIRGLDTRTTVSSNVFLGRLSRADATVLPGINGFSWIDTNLNGLRDVGELGQAGWTVELIDQAGQLLPLRRTIEPDNIPDGIISSELSPDVTLTSVGTDADGRIGVFPDTGTSTGSKNFQPFSRGAQSFQSTFGSSRQFRASFTEPTGVVQIDAVAPVNNSVGRMEAFNSAGELIGRFTTSVLASGEVATMTITRGEADIAYVVVKGHANTNIKLDNLQFGALPSTSTGPDGSYNFPYLSAGTYRVRMTPAEGSFLPLPGDSNIQTAIVTVGIPTSDVDFGFEVVASPWHNPNNPLDVNDDNIISALDVLLIVNEINTNGSRDLRGTNTPFPPYVDTTGENLLSAQDVIVVVNYLNGSGEGEVVVAARRSEDSGAAGHFELAFSPQLPQLTSGAEPNTHPPITSSSKLSFRNFSAQNPHILPPVGKISTSPFEDEEFFSSIASQIAVQLETEL